MNCLTTKHTGEGAEKTSRKKRERGSIAM